MKYGSVCSGIEAASVAWESLGWKAQWYSEIEPFPSAVLAHRFPSVPNLGDMTKIHETQFFNDSTINILVGGTPCQSFSVAGLRKGLADPRGNLMLTFLSLAQRKKPRWIVWENVPGVLSSNGGRDFATFLQALAELGYGFAYRVLDAQYFGVAQRRRRVFVVGYLGDWRPAGAVLFEQDCLSGNTKKSREKRKATSNDAQGGVGGGSDELAFTIGTTQDQQIAQPVPFRKVRRAKFKSDFETWEQDEKTNTLNTFDLGDIRTTQAVVQPSVAGFLPTQGSKANGIGWAEEQSPTLRAGCDSYGVIQPIAVDTYHQTINEHTTQTICTQSHSDQIVAVLTPQAVDFRNQNVSDDVTGTLQSKSNGGYSLNYQLGILEPTMAIRRLTPTECERLQGFPDGWTKIPYRNKPEDQCPDGPRYKACGNSMAVPVMRWIGQRIQMVENLINKENE